jgi:hypothetical protein
MFPKVFFYTKKFKNKIWSEICAERDVVYSGFRRPRMLQLQTGVLTLGLQ